MSVIRLRSSSQKGNVRFQPSVTRGMRSVSVRARSFDPATRRFSFVLASETPCRTYRLDRHWNLVEVDEILPMSALRGLDGFRGCPLLDTHASWSVRDVLGRITALRIEGTELIGDAFLSDRDDVAGVARDLETGVLGEFSVGFDILEDGVARERKGDVPLIEVAAWSVREGSLVPLPADSTATMRTSARSLSNARAKARPASARSLQNGASGMTPEELKTLLETSFRSMTDTIVGALTVDDDAGTDDLDAEAEAAAEEARAAVLAKRSAGKKPVAPAAGERSAADKAIVLGLRTACTKRGLGAEFDALEKSGADIAELRGVLTAGLRTSTAEIDGTTKPTQGARSLKDVKFENTTAGKRAAVK